MNLDYRAVVMNRYPELFENIDYIHPDLMGKYKLKNEKEETDLREFVDKIYTCLCSKNDQIFYHISDFLKFVRDNKVTVEQFLNNAEKGLTISDFKRFSLS